MYTELINLESEWLRALQEADSGTLENLLDAAFVSTPWNSGGALLLKDEYLNEALRVRFTDCNLRPIEIQVVNDFAIVQCRVACEYNFHDRRWSLDLFLNDLWVNRKGSWKALNRYSSAASEPRSVKVFKIN